MKTELAIKEPDFKTIQTKFENQYAGALQVSQGEARKVFERECSFAIQILSKNDYLNTCDKNSILGSVLNVAQVGLTLNPVEKEAYLVPRKNFKTGVVECCLDPSYMGMTKLAVKTGGIKSLEAHVIYQGDKIDFDMASDKKVRSHIPYFLAGNAKGEIIGAYSIAQLPDNKTHCEVMGKDDINKIRDKSESWKASQKKDAHFKSTWEEFEEEMCRKVVIKRHLKFLPRTRQLDYAIEYSNQAQNMRIAVSFHSLSYIEQLIQSSSLPQEKKERATMELDSIEYQDEADRMIEYLKENQPEDEKKQLTRKLR